MTIVPITSPDLDAAEVSWFAALCSDDYRFLGVPERIGVWFREGGHNHGLADWKALLDFMAWQLDGAPPRECFAPDPFPGTPAAFGWRAPGRH